MLDASQAMELHRECADDRSRLHFYERVFVEHAIQKYIAVAKGGLRRKDIGTTARRPAPRQSVLPPTEKLLVSRSPRPPLRVSQTACDFLVELNSGMRLVCVQSH